MSRSERKRRYRARRRRRWVPLNLPAGFDIAQDELSRMARAALGVPVLELMGVPKERVEQVERRAGLDFGYPNAAVVVADHTGDGKWVIRASGKID